MKELVMELFWKLFGALRPSSSQDPKTQLQWRWAIAISTGLLLAYAAAHSAWALNAFSPEIPGPASKRDVEDAKTDFKHLMDKNVGDLNRKITNVQKTVDSINLRLIKNDILEQLTARCIAKARGNADAFGRAGDELNGVNGAPGLLDQYMQMTGHPYDIQTCEEIMIVPQAK